MRAPWFGATEAAQRNRERASASLSKLKRPLPQNPGAKGPSTLQALAARRTSKLYYENIDDPRYKQNLYGERKSSGVITWTLGALEKALALDDAIREATGGTISEKEAESRKQWRTPIER